MVVVGILTASSYQLLPCCHSEPRSSFSNPSHMVAIQGLKLSFYRLGIVFHWSLFRWMSSNSLTKKANSTTHLTNQPLIWWWRRSHVNIVRLNEITVTSMRCKREKALTTLLLQWLSSLSLDCQPSRYLVYKNYSSKNETKWDKFASLCLRCT